MVAGLSQKHLKGTVSRDHALFDVIRSTMPCKEPELVFKFFLGSCDLKLKGENSWRLMPNKGG